MDMPKEHSVWVTGGSGLLGHQVAEIFAREGIRVLAPRHADCELTDKAQVRAFADAAHPTLIINCAAVRKPDICAQNPEAAARANCALPRILAHLGVPMIHISTDYVFDGKHAPYEPDAVRGPVNTYGEQKAEAEAALEHLAHVLILRVPILFGPTDDLRNSAVTVLAANMLAARGVAVPMDDVAIRYPTFTTDIARQLVLLAPAVGKTLHGIYHYSGREAMTKYMMALSMLPLLGLTEEVCVPDRRPTAVPRPYDCHLSTASLEATGLFFEPTPFATAMALTLAHSDGP